MFKLWVVQTLLSLLVLLDQTMAQTPLNITVDDTDPSISYTGNWEPSSSHTSALDIGGSHTLSEDPNGSATFSFTGVAVYYLSPKWPYYVDSYVAIDGQAAILVNLTGPPVSTDPNGEETIQSAPLWSATGLSNGNHRVVVTRGPSGYAVVDGFIYTTQSGSSSSLVLGTVVTTTTFSGTASQPSSTSADISASNVNSTVIIAVTVSASIVCLILLIILAIVCMRRSKNTDRNSTAFASDNRRKSTYNNPRQGTNTYSGTYSAVPLTGGHSYTYPYSNNNNPGSSVAGVEMGTRDSRYSAMGYSESTTGSASGAGSISAQQQMGYANAPLSGQDAYGLYPVSNRALVVPAVGAAYNTGGSGTGTDWYNASGPGAGGGYHGGDPGGHNAAAAYAGIASSSAAAVAPPNPPSSPLSGKARFEGSHTPYPGGSNAGHSAYAAYASTSTVAVGVPVATTAPARQPSPVSEKARYNNAGAGVSGLSIPHPYNAAGPISPSEPPPSYAERPGPHPTPSSPPRPNKQGFI